MEYVGLLSRAKSASDSHGVARPDSSRQASFLIVAQAHFPSKRGTAFVPKGRNGNWN